MPAPIVDLPRPPCGPPPGTPRPWQWTDHEPWTDREKRLAALSPHFETRTAAAERGRRRTTQEVVATLDQEVIA